MEIHHDRHHAAYVANLNNVAKDQSADRGTGQDRGRARQSERAVTDGIQIHRPQQSRRPRQPHHVLGNHGPERRQAGGRGAGRDRPRSRRHGKIPERVQRRRRTPVRLRLGVRDRHQGRQARDRDPPEPGQPDHGRQARADGQRRLGARLLSQLPEPPRRLSQGVVEHGELEQDRASAMPRRRPARSACERGAGCEKGGLAAALCSSLR